MRGFHLPGRTQAFLSSFGLIRQHVAIRVQLKFVLLQRATQVRLHVDAPLQGLAHLMRVELVAVLAALLSAPHLPQHQCMYRSGGADPLAAPGVWPGHARGIHSLR